MRFLLSGSQGRIESAPNAPDKSNLITGGENSSTTLSAARHPAAIGKRNPLPGINPGSGLFKNFHFSLPEGWRKNGY
jgi:hypothetical protein